MLDSLPKATRSYLISLFSSDLRRLQDDLDAAGNSERERILVNIAEVKSHFATVLGIGYRDPISPYEAQRFFNEHCYSDNLTLTDALVCATEANEYRGRPETVDFDRRFTGEFIDIWAVFLRKLDEAANAKLGVS